ncbi:MAG: UDP-galactopyranose mutase [Steroidobacteraceae bacterium]|nr:UDP-galactopyranose mutase [Steroidobacteraceae bacterium]
MTIAVVGAGFSGAVVARELADAGRRVRVFESRDHAAGNCDTRRDPATGVMVHTYGPHIFHTDNEDVWRYVCRFDDMMPFTNRVKAVAAGRVYSLPINLLTINSFFGRTLDPREAAAFIRSNREDLGRAAETFEEQALSTIGRELYEAFFRGYTIKQWGCAPAELPASILKRLPIRFSYDDNYYESRHQGIPRHGYTHVVDRILDHPNVETSLNSTFSRAMRDDFEHVFYSGPIDEWFGYCEGRLAYRTLDFAPERHAGDFQGNAVINYCDLQVPWTRITEHKHFAPWEEHEQTVIYREYSREPKEGDVLYYPLRHSRNTGTITAYMELARAEPNTTFVGRLGTYRYLDMDVTIAEARAAARSYLGE